MCVCVCVWERETEWGGGEGEGICGPSKDIESTLDKKEDKTATTHYSQLSWAPALGCSTGASLVSKTWLMISFCLPLQPLQRQSSLSSSLLIYFILITQSFQEPQTHPVFSHNSHPPMQLATNHPFTSHLPPQSSHPVRWHGLTLLFVWSPVCLNVAVLLTLGNQQ